MNGIQASERRATMRSEPGNAAQTAGDPKAKPVEISADENSNTLSILADVSAMPTVTKIIDELAKQSGPAREVKMLAQSLWTAEMTEFCGSGLCGRVVRQPMHVRCGAAIRVSGVVTTLLGIGRLGSWFLCSCFVLFD